MDPQKIVLVGQGFGAWLAAMSAASDPKVIAAALVSLEDVGREGSGSRADLERLWTARILEAGGSRGLAASGADALADEAARNAARFGAAPAAAALGSRPLLLVTADDGSEPASAAFAAARPSEDAAEIVREHVAGDGLYSGGRIALAAAVVRWLENLEGAPAGL